MPDQFFDLPPIETDAEEPGTRDYAIVEWCEGRLRRGVEFIESQIGYDKIGDTLDEIFSFERSGKASYIPLAGKGLSKTKLNMLPKISEDLTAGLTDTRYFWNYTSQNPAYEKQAYLSNKRGARWYADHNIDMRIGDAIITYTFAGTGVIHHYYSRQLDDFMVESEDPRNVFPIDPLTYHTFEDSSAVILRRARTPEWVREEFGKIVSPDAGSKGGIFGWIQRIMEGPASQPSAGPLFKKSKADKPIPASPTVYVNTMYLKDRRNNDTGKTVRMGPWEDNRPASPWSYEVGPKKPLFPFKRLIVWGGGAKLYDGPSPYWHGRYPVIKLTLNPFPNTWFGKAPLWDCLPLQASMTANLRVIDDHSNQVAQPGVVGDRNVSKAEMNKVNTRAAGMKIRTNTASGKGIQVLNPPPLDQLIWEVIKFCDEKMGKISGTADPSAMASLAQIPSDDTIDTIMKAMTPGIRLRSRRLEAFYKELSFQYLYNQWEWDSMAKRIAMFGPQAVTKEDFDYTPGVGIPDDIPGMDEGDIGVDALALDTPRPLYARCKAMLMAFQCKFDPSSLLNSAAQQELMRYFLLAKMGYISVFTLMEKMGIMNFAPPGLTIPTDEIGRLQLQQSLGIGMIANAQGRKATDSAPPSMGETGNGPTIQTS